MVSTKFRMPSVIIGWMPVVVGGPGPKPQAPGFKLSCRSVSELPQLLVAAEPISRAILARMIGCERSSAVGRHGLLAGLIRKVAGVNPSPGRPLVRKSGLSLIALFA
jgi:hypothetical protein